MGTLGPLHPACMLVCPHTHAGLFYTHCYCTCFWVQLGETGGGKGITCVSAVNNIVVHIRVVWVCYTLTRTVFGCRAPAKCLRPCFAKCVCLSAMRVCPLVMCRYIPAIPTARTPSQHTSMPAYALAQWPPPPPPPSSTSSLRHIYRNLHTTPYIPHIYIYIEALSDGISEFILCCWAISHILWAY